MTSYYTQTCSKCGKFYEDKKDMSSHTLSSPECLTCYNETIEDDCTHVCGTKTYHKRHHPRETCDTCNTVIKLYKDIINQKTTIYMDELDSNIYRTDVAFRVKVEKIDKDDETGETGHASFMTHFPIPLTMKLNGDRITDPNSIGMFILPGGKFVDVDNGRVVLAWQVGTGTFDHVFGVFGDD